MEEAGQTEEATKAGINEAENKTNEQTTFHYCPFFTSQIVYKCSLLRGAEFLFL
jgi:hypothetical protein